MVLVLKQKPISKLRQITEILGHNFRVKISIGKLIFFYKAPDFFPEHSPASFLNTLLLLS